MPTQCRLTDGEKPHSPGDIYFDYWPKLDNPADEVFLKHLSAQYKTDWIDKRAPIIVVLPNGLELCIDNTTNDPNPATDGWTVTGDVPNITIFPSINCYPIPGQEGYHGFLVNGVLSDDVAGRRYDVPVPFCPYCQGGRVIEKLFSTINDLTSERDMLRKYVDAAKELCSSDLCSSDLSHEIYMLAEGNDEKEET